MSGPEDFGVLEAIDLPVVIVGHDCKLVRFNRAAAEALGMTSSDIGRMPGSLKATAAVTHLEQSCAQVIADGMPFRCDVSTGDRFFQLHIAPFAPPDGQKRGAVLTFANVTAFRASIGQAIYEREYTKMILNTIIDPLVVLDSKFQIQTANRAFYDWFGVSRELTQGLPLHNVSDGWRVPALWESLEETLASNREFQAVECQFESKVMGRRTVLLDARRLARDGRALVLLALRDITKLKSAEQANDKLAAIVQSSNDAIISKDLDGNITSWNGGAERMFGYTAGEAIGRSITMLIPPDMRNEETALLDRVRRGEQIEHFETVRRRKDGSVVHISLSISLITDAHGRIVGASKIARDITDRKKAEESLAHADQRKTEFLAMLAHELRNPLAPIRNAVQVLQRAFDDRQSVQSMSEMMARQVNQMVRLVDDLLEVSRISSGKIALYKGRTELASTVNHAVEAARHQSESLDHELTVNLPQYPLYINADPVRLAQVVGNLLSNAFKFTAKGGQISLTVEREGEQAVIRVRDTGIGIAADQIPLVFGMFIQLDTSLERPTSGLGIGLALVKHLVEMHDGTVEIRSAGVGQGSEFVVRLPIMLGTIEAPPQEPIACEPMHVTGRRILIVDDNADSAVSLAMLLESSGYETHVAHDGVEAQEVAAILRPDVILLDIGLPKLDGYGAARWLRDQPWGKNMVIIALTGWGQESDKHRSKDAGFDAHMVKPVDVGALVRLMETLTTAVKD